MSLQQQVYGQKTTKCARLSLHSTLGKAHGVYAERKMEVLQGEHCWSVRSHSFP